MSTQELEITPAVLPDTPKVSVGPTSVAGWGATAAGVIGMVLVLVLHVDQEEAALISTAAMTVIAFVVTQAGRYAQSRELAKGAADAHRAVVARLTMPPRMIGAVPSSTGPSGDPDNPLVERPLTDEELASLAGPEVVDDPDADPPQGRVVRDDPQA